MPVPQVARPPVLGVQFPAEAIEAFCRKWQVVQLALFGSALRGDFRPDSDVDVLVTFDPTARPTLLTLVRMRRELAQIAGRPVDLLERGGLERADHPAVRDEVLRTMAVIYAK